MAESEPETLCPARDPRFTSNAWRHTTHAQCLPERTRIALALTILWAPSLRVAAGEVSAHADTAKRQSWYNAAAEMRRLAESWGDQPFGAVLVLDSQIIGLGPSRVVKNADPTAHAEREALRDARLRLGRQDLSGSILVSTSRPCSACEAAAAKARVGRMLFGPDLQDAGKPRP